MLTSPYVSHCIVEFTFKLHSTFGLLSLSPLEELCELFRGCGFDCLENGYIERETVNHKEGKTAARVFVQGKYLKRGEPPSAPHIEHSSIEGESQQHDIIKGESHTAPVDAMESS